MLLGQGLFAGGIGLFVRRRSFLREGTDEQDELPALVFGHAPFEGGHRLSTLADLVEEGPISGGVLLKRGREIGWVGLVAHGFVAVVLSPVALGIGAPFRLCN